MPVLTLNDLPVIKGIINIPERGRAVARLTVPDDEIAKGDTVTAEFQDGTQLNLTCIREQAEGAFHTVLLVGGGNKLKTVLKPKFYSSVSVKTAVTDAITEAGERIGKIELSGQLEQWTRRAEELSDALEMLLFGRDVSYRFGLDGKIYIAPRANTKHPKNLVSERDLTGQNGYCCLFDETLEPDRIVEIERDGQLVTGRCIRVVHRLETDKERTEVYLELDSSTHPALDFQARYSGQLLKIHAPSGGQTFVDIKPDDSRLPYLTRIPLRTFLPSVKLEILPSARLLIGFEGGKPSKPFAELWELGSLQKLEIPSPQTIFGDGLLEKAVLTALGEMTILQSAAGVPNPASVGLPMLYGVPAIVVTGGSSKLKVKESP